MRRNDQRKFPNKMCCAHFYEWMSRKGEFAARRPTGYERKY